MWAREPGQVRKEAALSGSRHVMQASLARAKGGGHAREPLLDGGCTVHFATSTVRAPKSIVASHSTLYAVLVERGSWTDARLDDLSDRVDAGFERVDRDIRELRGEVASVRGEIGALRGEIVTLRLILARVGGGIIMGLVGVIAAVVARGGA